MALILRTIRILFSDDNDNNNTFLVLKYKVKNHFVVLKELKIDKILKVSKKFSNFLPIDEIEFLGKIKIECIVKKRKNKKIIIIYKVNKGFKW